MTALMPFENEYIIKSTENDLRTLSDVGCKVTVFFHIEIHFEIMTLTFVL